jgi:hypothetical protein
MSIKYLVSLFVAALIGFAISPSYSQEVIFCDGFECAEGNPELEARIAALEAMLADVSRGTDPNTNQDTLTFSGMNVQVVSGSGTTDGIINGTGNLIVGYNEWNILPPDGRTGSHMLVVGTRNNYTSFGGIVVGSSNTVSGIYASVSGGVGSTANGEGASVSGGASKTADSFACTTAGNIGTDCVP